MASVRPLVAADDRQRPDRRRPRGGRLPARRRAHPGAAAERRRPRPDLGRLLGRRVTSSAGSATSTAPTCPCPTCPITVQHAVLAAEDRDFYDHGGFSPVGIGRAVWNNVSGGSTQGGSTITQQYAKNAFLSQERSWQRKLKELVLSVKLETTREQGRHPPGLPEHRVLRSRRVRDRGGGADLLRRAREGPHHRPGRDAGVAAEVAGGDEPGSQPGAAEGPLRLRARGHGREGRGWARTPGTRPPSPRCCPRPRPAATPAPTATCSTPCGRTCSPRASTRRRWASAGCRSRRRSTSRRRPPRSPPSTRPPRPSAPRAFGSAWPRSAPGPARSSRCTAARTT